MLVIQMPDGHGKKKTRRRVRALGYLISGLVIMTCLFLCMAAPLWVFAVTITVETWWVWAVLTDPNLER